MHLRIERYTPAMAEAWDEAVRASRNGIFQHLRGYMDYHSDRFADRSLVALDERDRIVALLPAHAGAPVAPSREEDAGASSRVAPRGAPTSLSFKQNTAPETTRTSG
ncbi:MAG: hypothetical protein K2M55_00085, partial [Muribaculaceae bacterium]|nr:hypothetical protein [Muribaculaceae bacterium]